jgi:UDP-N-acetylmuramate dehydrogenase
MFVKVNDTEIKDIFEKGLFKGEIKFDEPMAAHTSLRIGGTVDIMVFPEDPVSLKNVMLAAEREKIPLLIFGAGTNLLVGDERIEGVAISLKGFRSIELTRETDNKNAVLYIGSGVPLTMLVNFAQKNGYSGLEALAGIPGFVGGAVYMNAGSFGTEMKDVIVSLALMNTHGKIEILEKEKIDFSYRSSNLPEGSIILSANIVLKKDDTGKVEKRTKEFLKKKKDSQPLGELSAGCVFRNPEGEAASRLIEIAGCKGLEVGGVEVSKVHANFFINKGKATCKDFIVLMDTVKTKVESCCGIALEPEIRIIGKNA